MKKSTDNIFPLSNVSEINDTLSEILSQGAKKMLAAAIENEVQKFLEKHQGIQDDQGRRLVVRNGDFPDALKALLGKNAQGLSSNTICRLKAKWEEDYDAFTKQDLSKAKIVYLWVDGVYLQTRLDNDKQCLLVVIGADETGKKQVLTLNDGYCESTSLSRPDHLFVRHNNTLNVPAVMPHTLCEY